MIKVDKKTRLSVPMGLIVALLAATAAGSFSTAVLLTGMRRDIQEIRANCVNWYQWQDFADRLREENQPIHLVVPRLPKPNDPVGSRDMVPPADVDLAQRRQGF